MALRNIKAANWGKPIQPVRMETKASAASAAILSMSGSGQVVWHCKDYRKYAREGYIENAEVHSCINLLASAVKGIRFKVYQKEKNDKRTALDQHDLLRLIRRSDPSTSGPSFFEQYTIDLFTTGNAFVERAGPFEANEQNTAASRKPPTYLYIQRPDRMYIIKGTPQQLIAGYQYRDWYVQQSNLNPQWLPDSLKINGIIQPVHKILHSKFFNPADDWMGLCYHRDTEILTKDRGWQKFGDLSSEDEVATRNPLSKKFEWQRPTAYINRAYEGDLYHFKTRSLDLLVTPEHRMLVQGESGQGKSAERILSAKELSTKALKHGNLAIPMCSEWEGTEISEVVFPYVKNNGDWSFKLSGDDYCALMGAFISEGNMHGNKGIEINQYPASKGFKLYQDLLLRINGSALHDGRAFILSRRAIVEHFKTIGKCHEKFVPEIIRNATKRQIQIFWQYYMAGDGCYQPSTSTGSRKQSDPGYREEAVTNSRLLADQLVEIVQKLGYSASVYTRKGGPATIKGVECNTRESYRVRVRYSSYAAVRSCEKVHYTGTIHCVSVPNGIVYVRRNGKPAWCGNSPVEVAGKSVDQINAAQIWNVSLLQNGARPSGLLSIEGINQEQKEQLEDDFQRKHGGMANVGKTIIVGGASSTYTRLSNTAQEMDWSAAQGLATERICSVFKVPPELIGQSSHRTFQNWAEARKSFYEEAVQPFVDFMLGEFNYWLQPFYGEDIEIGYDANEIEALQEDRKYVHDLAIRSVLAGIMTPNVALKKMGEDPLPPEVGDVLYVPSTSVATPLDGSAPTRYGRPLAALPSATPADLPAPALPKPPAANARVTEMPRRNN